MNARTTASVVFRSFIVLVMCASIVFCTLGDAWMFPVFLAGVLAAAAFVRLIIAKLEKAKLQPAPKGAKPEEDVMTTSPSNHPMAKKGGAVSGTLGLILDLLVAAGIYYYVCGIGTAPASTFTFVGLTFPIEVAAGIAAWINFILACIFSVTRERSPGWASVDLFGTVLVALVIGAAVVSLFHPVFAAILAGIGLPRVQFNTLTMSILGFFGVATVVYAFVFHLRRSRVGLEAATNIDTVGRDDRRSGTEEILAATYLDGYVVLPVKPGYNIEYIPKTRLVVSDRPVAAS